MEEINKQMHIEKAKDASKIIYTTLRNEIMNTTIKPGEEIVESNTCSRFNASRTPVREAFQRLQSSGLMTTIPYKGSFASLLNYNVIEQVIFMRGIVEAAVISDFIKEITSYQVEELRYKINIQRILLEENFDPIRFFESDNEFHEIWFKHQKKEHLWKIIQKSQLHYSRFKMLDLNSKEHCEKIFIEHTQLFELIEKRNTDDAAKHIKAHLQGGIDRVAERISTDYSAYFL